VHKIDEYISCKIQENAFPVKYTTAEYLSCKKHFNTGEYISCKLKEKTPVKYRRLHVM